MFNSQACIMTNRPIDPIDPAAASDPGDDSPSYQTMTARCSLYLDTLPALESVDLQESLRQYLPHIEAEYRAEALNTWLSTHRDYEHLSARLGWT